MNNRLLILILLMTATLSLSGQIIFAETAVSSDAEVPLVLVNEDTVTTDDLRLELEIMEKMNPEAVGIIFSEPEKILRRLMQNQLILQEGYRMEIDKSTAVTNQVREMVRSRCIVTLLDSVSLTVSADSLELREARMLAVRTYIDGLRTTYNVSIDSTLLKSLDYASADEEVQNYLRTNTDVVATVPTGSLTVARLSKAIRFKEFHGLVGKADAGERRDKILDEWIVESVLNYQAKLQRVDQDPEIQEAARNLEHVLVRQETIEALLQTGYEPQQDEIEQFYEENLDEFMRPLRVKMKSKKLNTEEAAQAFREKLLAGAHIEWLAANDPEVIAGNDPFPYEWFEPAKLGLKLDGIELGFIPEPYGVPGGWVVAVVQEIEEPTPLPLADCRNLIIPMLKARNNQTAMADIMARLEDASEIKFMPGAEDAVRGVLEEKN